MQKIICQLSVKYSPTTANDARLAGRRATRAVGGLLVEGPKDGNLAGRTGREK